MLVEARTPDEIREEGRLCQPRNGCRQANEIPSLTGP